MEHNQSDELVDELFDVLPRFASYVRRLGHRIVEPHALSRSHMAVLSALGKTGAQPMTELACRLGLAKPNLTVLVDRLAELALVAREPGQADRRQVRLRLTEAGGEQLRRYRDALREVTLAGLAAYSEPEIVDLRTTLASLRLLMERQLFQEVPHV